MKVLQHVGLNKRTYYIYMYIYILIYLCVPQVSDDEVIVSDCNLQDVSVTPLLKALHVYKTFAMLDLSHNLLGNCN